MGPLATASRPATVGHNQMVASDGFRGAWRTNPTIVCPMERERPSYVKRYTTALATPAITRWQNDEAHRELANERSMQVIEKPWTTELPQVGATREFGFLRDFWNLFHECIQACQTLDLVRDLAPKSIDAVDPGRYTATVTYWAESYLNEVYIVQCRLLDLIKFIQRRYKKDVDFTQFVMEVGDSLAAFVQEQLSPLIQDRGVHVHERRELAVLQQLPCEQRVALDEVFDHLGDGRAFGLELACAADIGTERGGNANRGHQRCTGALQNST